VIIGNHDYYQPGNPQAQIDYYHQGRDTRWTFPDYQYTKTWNIPYSTRTLQIVFINTVTLCPEGRSGGIGFPPNLNNTYPNTDPAAQRINDLYRQPTLQWIKNQLQTSTADFLIVAGHYNIWPAASSPEADCLQANLVPVMHQYGVNLYINGHIHNMDHWLVNGMNFVTSGHGSDLNDHVGNYSTTNLPNGLMFRQSVGGFGMMKITARSLTWQFVDETGNIIYKFSVPYSPKRKALRGHALVY
jgi:tartrate-resistant acid phosphatase type 5